jgi:3-oxoacyl-[acyl-carrier protein] reductase
MSTIASKRRVAVVSGGTGAIGQAVAARLLGDNTTVIILGRDAARLERAKHAIAADAVRHAGAAYDLGEIEVQVVELRDDEGVVEAIEAIGARFGGIDVLVHAAGDGPFGRLGTTTEAMWSETIEVKLLGAVRLVRAAAAFLERSPQGSVVVVSGAFARDPDPLFAVNSTVNSALAGFVKAVARDLGARGVRVNVVHPGVVESPLWAHTAEAIGAAAGTDADAVNRQIRELIPTGSFLAPDDVAGAVAYLVSSDAKQINGAAITIDGGMTRALP